MSELWKNKDFCDSILLPNYKLASTYCRKTHDGGGVCAIVKDTIDYIERKDINNYSKEFIIEFSAIEIPKLNCIIIGLYRADRNIDIFYSQMEKVLYKLNTKNLSKHIIIGGDFNINILKPNKESKELINLMHSHNFKTVN